VKTLNLLRDKQAELPALLEPLRQLRRPTPSDRVRVLALTGYADEHLHFSNELDAGHRDLTIHRTTDVDDALHAFDDHHIVVLPWDLDPSSKGVIKLGAARTAGSVMQEEMVYKLDHVSRRIKSKREGAVVIVATDDGHLPEGVTHDYKFDRLRGVLKEDTLLCKVGDLREADSPQKLADHILSADYINERKMTLARRIKFSGWKVEAEYEETPVGKFPVSFTKFFDAAAKSGEQLKDVGFTRIEDSILKDDVRTGFSFVRIGFALSTVSKDGNDWIISEKAYGRKFRVSEQAGMLEVSDLQGSPKALKVNDGKGKLVAELAVDSHHKDGLRIHMISHLPIEEPIPHKPPAHRYKRLARGIEIIERDVNFMHQSA